MIDHAIRHLLDKMNVPPLSLRAARASHMVRQVALTLVGTGTPAEDIRFTPSREVPGLVYVSVGPPTAGPNTVPVVIDDRGDERRRITSD